MQATIYDPPMEPVGGATAATKATLSAVRVGDTTKRNNRLALRVYEDLIRWARDVLQEEARELDAKREELNKRNLLYSGLANAEDGRIREASRSGGATGSRLPPARSRISTNPS